MITLTHKIDIAIEDLAQQICGEAQDLQAELLTAILQEVKTWTPEERLDQCQAIACEVPNG